MQEIKLTKSNRAIATQKAIEILESGGVIVYPTETSYGLGCDFYNKKALDKIYKIKNRDKKNPLPIIIPNLTAASTLVNFSDMSRKLADEHWPGPLTLVLPFKYCKWQDHCDDYLALRVSDHFFANDLSNAYGKPIVSTSANISNNDNIYLPQKVRQEFKNQKFQPDLFIEAGELKSIPPSTIVKIHTNNKIEILRQGEIKINI